MSYVCKYIFVLKEIFCTAFTYVGLIQGFDPELLH